MLNKYTLLFVLFFSSFFYACDKARVHDKKEWKQLFDSYQITDACIIIKDQTHEIVDYYNLNRCRKRFTPASTFKIMNSLIALETNTIPDESYTIQWDGVKRRPDWDTTMDMRKAFEVSNLIYYQQNAFEFDARLLHLKAISQRDLFLFGYWQAFPYIETIRPILQSEFKTKKSIAEHYQPYLEQIRSSEAVMLHIRRGDYVNSPSAAKFHGVLPLSYYQQAIEALLLNEPDAHFFVFSDDLPWAKEALPKNLDITFVENALRADAAAQELQLMTQCKHHIIANSSLSWWGAWLKPDSNSLVYAPNRWISDSSLDLSKLLPARWNRIPA